MLNNLFSREPAIVTSLLVALVQAIAALLIAFNVPLTGEQVTAIVGFISATLAVGFLVRPRVTPNAVVKEIVEEAKESEVS